MILRRDIHLAFDEIAPSMSGLSERVVSTVVTEGATRRRKEGMIFRLRAPLSLVAILAVVVLVGAALVGGRLVQDWNAFHKSTPAGQTYESQVAQLEQTPLHIPAVQSHEACKSGPFNSAGHFGSGPLYGVGGAVTGTDWGVYYHNLAYANTKVTGPILVRARDLFTNQPVIFVGQYAAGPVVGSDTVDGKRLDQHLDLLLDTSNASTTVKTHKFDWPFIAGVPSAWSGSTGWQIDGIGFSEVFLAC